MNKERFTEKIEDGRNILRKGYENIFKIGFGPFIAGEVIDKLSEYEDLEENKLLIRLPVSAGETVYVIAECSHVNKKLDGTLYDSNGGYGTATGYYCSYEDSCPHDCDEFTCCEDYEEKLAVFEDTVSSIQIDESGLMIFTENLGVCGVMGEHIFFSKEEAEKKLIEFSTE